MTDKPFFRVEKSETDNSGEGCDCLDHANVEDHGEWTIDWNEETAVQMMIRGISDQERYFHTEAEAQTERDRLEGLLSKPFIQPPEPPPLPPDWMFGEINARAWRNGWLSGWANIVNGLGGTHNNWPPVVEGWNAGQEAGSQYVSSGGGQ